MEKYQERVVQEQKDLKSKIDKLENFLGDYHKRLIPFTEEYSLLCNQLEMMIKYNEILLERIKLHKDIRRLQS